MVPVILTPTTKHGYEDEEGHEEFETDEFDREDGIDVADKAVPLAPGVKAWWSRPLRIFIQASGTRASQRP
jgi:hypothetical protein